jgi:4-hydroxyphenylacetate 3-monooxygenase
MRRRRSGFDNPISSRFDENDALIYFRRREGAVGARVRASRSRHVPRPVPRHAGARLPELSGADPPLGEDQVSSAGLAHRLTEAIGTTAMPPVREQLGFPCRAGQHGQRMMAGMEAEGTMRGEWYVPNKHFMYSAQVLTQDLYPKVINTLRDLSGGALIMLPSSIHDYETRCWRRSSTRRSAPRR